MLVTPQYKLERISLLLAALVAVAVFFGITDTASGQTSDETLAALQEQGMREGWTFTVGQTPVSDNSIDELCGLVVPEDWWVGAPLGDTTPRLGLPTAYDWRDSGGCPPVRNQGSCGSCWAFATVGPLECNILIHDGVEVDLSEQWLVSCNQSGYGCGGGWWAHDYHEWRTDSCGGTGAVLEADFPYAASNLPCNCPYDHPYTIDDWAYVGSSGGIPSTAAIKQAIMDYGPVSVAVCVTSAFQGYNNGIFNACSGGQVNHGVVLVGWDDSQGTNGVWILRNSWGPYWGESGYMRIEYGCSSIGYAACYVQYSSAGGPSLEVTPASHNFGSINIGGNSTQSFTVKNVGLETLSGSASGLSAPFSFVGDTSYTLNPGQSDTITVRFAPTVQGSFNDNIQFTGGGGATRSVSGSGIGGGAGNNCADAPSISDGTYIISNVGAGTDDTASCGGGGTSDVWWRYVAPHAGVVDIHTCWSDFDTVLSVYNTCGGTELACNDDYPGCGTGGSRVSLAVSPGQVLRIRVAGCAGQTGDVMLSIVTSVPSRTISGRMTTAAGDPVAGVTLTGLPGEPVTNANGEYTATVDYGFIGTATPWKTGYLFQPANRSYINVTSNQSNQDYQATPPNFTISGNVTDQFGDPVRGVTINGLPGNPVTGAGGNYQATVPLGFSGTATPSMSGSTFMPTSRIYSYVTSDMPSQDYFATLPTGYLRVTIDPAGALDDGAAWRVDGGSWHDSDATVEVTVGQHTVSYTSIPEWTGPGDEQVSIIQGQTVPLIGTYTQQAYKLDIVTEPSAAGQVSAAPMANSQGEYVQDAVVTLLATPEPGFRVLGWSGADEGPASGQLINTVTMTCDRMVIVEFAVEPFAMFQLSTAVTGGEGWIAPGHGSHSAGSIVTLTATPASGYRIMEWSGTDDDSSTDVKNTVTMNNSKIVTVEFEPWPDCNADGTPDAVNIADLISTDCNGNGIPDECEPDTDGDGTIDDCDASFDLMAIDPTSISQIPSISTCGMGMVQMLALTLVGLGFLRRGSGNMRCF